MNTQKNLFVNQAAPKKFSKIFLPKQIPKSKTSNQKRSFDHPCHLESGAHPPPPPPLGLRARFSALENCLLNVLESNFKAREKLTGREKGKGRGGPFSPQFPPVFIFVFAFFRNVEQATQLVKEQLFFPFLHEKTLIQLSGKEIKNDVLKLRRSEQQAATVWIQTIWIFLDAYCQQ